MWRGLDRLASSAFFEPTYPGGEPTKTVRTTNKWSGTEEGKQVGVEPVLVGGAEAVRCAGIDFQRGAFHELGRELGRGADRHDLVVITMNDERRDVELLEISREVGFGEGFDAVEYAMEAGLHCLQPECIPKPLGDLRPGPVGSIEGQ